MKSRNQVDSQIADEAVDWLLRLEDTDVDPDDPYPDPVERQHYFFTWLTQSPEHLRVFLELYEAYRKLEHADPRRLIDLDELLKRQPAEVVALFSDDDDDAPIRLRPILEHVAKQQSYRHKVWALSGLVAVASVAILVFIRSPVSKAYATAVGEQRTCQLEDGSVVYLNTDTSVEVRYTRSRRTLRLLRGEALFVVEKDARRPFVVDVGGVGIRALGTRFNVYRHDRGTDVSVIEGMVQLTSPDGTPDAVSTGDTGFSDQGHASRTATTIHTTTVQKGEQASIADGQITVHQAPDINKVISWRDRRLSFRDTPLSEIAAEFNRYNHHQIRVEGDVAQRLPLTAEFNADQPQVLLRYIDKRPGLTVQPEGDDWVIRAR